VARVLAVRRAIGSGRALRLDANGGYGPAQAEVALRAFALHAPELCEQPVAPGQTRVWKGLSAICPLAADESCADPLELDELLRARALVAVVLKPAVLGGLLPALAIARRARAQGAEPILSTALESRVGRAAAAHLAAALRSRLPAGLGSGGLFAADLPADLREEGGALSFPSEAQSAAGPAGVLSGQGAP
jgi:L-alanine-DL-glutamate epimerase-like enolase superfamily enzyme